MSGRRKAETVNGFVVTPPVIVDDWKAFYDWAKDGGYDESYFNRYDCKCLALQEQYLEEMREQEDSTPASN